MNVKILLYNMLLILQSRTQVIELGPSTICSSPVQRTCENPLPELNVDCYDMPVCEWDLVLYDGECISLDDCPSDIVCSEVPFSTFRTCQSSIQPTCADPFPQNVTADCVSTCVCDPGYVMDDHHTCIRLDECPGIELKDCSRKAFSTFRRCQSSTQPTCANPNPIAQLMDCRDMCVCLPDYVLLHGHCVPRQSCPKPDCAVIPNTEFRRCQTLPQPQCLNPNPSVWYPQCKDLCVCKQGYILHKGNCILESSCPSRSTNFRELLALMKLNY